MAEPIRVLHVLSAMERAGTETLLMNLYRNIDRNKVQFDFAVSATDKAAYDDEIVSLGGIIYHYPRYRGKNHFAYKEWWNLFFKKHPEYHIVHGHIGSTAAIYLNIAKKHGCFTIAHSHSTYGKPNAQQIMYRIFSFPTRFVADQFLGCSMLALETRYGDNVAHNTDKAQILHNAIDAKKFRYNSEIRKRIRDEFSINNNEFIVGTVGRMTPSKNPYFTLDIIEKLSKSIQNFKFLWVGTGELENDIKRIIKEKKLENKVIFTGSVSNANEMYQAMDVFIFPSLYEGLGNVAIEAQAAGLPTICSIKVPKEAKATELAEFIPLDNAKIWCKKLLELMKLVKSYNYMRPDTYNIIVGANYDIVGVTKWLENLYLRRW